MSRIKQLTNVFPKYSGGRTKNIIKLANYFSNKGIKNSIITSTYDFQIPRTVEKLKNEGLLNEDIEVVSMFDYLSGDYQNNSFKYFQNANIDLKSDFKRIDNYTYLSNDDTTRIVVDKDDWIITKEILVGGVRNIKYWFNSNGNIARKVIFKNNRHSNEFYYDNNGNCYLKMSHYTFIKWRFKKIKLLNEAKIFYKDSSMRKWYFKKVFNKKDTIINSARKIDIPLISLNKKLDFDVYFWFHNPHINNYEYKKNGNLTLSNSYRSIFEMVHEPKIIVFTNEQKSDIIKYTNVVDENIFIIPLSSFYESNEPDLIQSKNHNLISIVSRLDNNQKNLTVIIEAFDKFLEKFPNYILEIWGDGPDYEMIEKLIFVLGRESKIILKGRSNEPLKVFSNSVFSIVCSNYGGLDSTILESLKSGTPVLAAPFKYGSKELLSNDLGGLITSGFDKESIYDGMIKIIGNINNYKPIDSYKNFRSLQLEYESIFLKNFKLK